MRGVIVFVKNPEIGKVKTRLAATLGNEKALEIYLKLLDYTRRVLMELKDIKKYVFYSSFIDNEDEWTNDLFEKDLQPAGRLGERIIAAFSATFEKCNKVVIIGSDCPQLSATHIEDAFYRLDSHDVVIGPSHDGGYYLIGMNKFHPELFQDINWSTDSVYQETLQKVDSLNLEIGKLETLSDVDYEADWVKYGF